MTNYNFNIAKHKFKRLNHSKFTQNPKEINEKVYFQ